MAAQPIYIVVGGGLAGLMTTIKIAEAGHAVQLFSMVPVKRSHSVCAQGGINAAVNTKGEGDSPDIHSDDTVYGGDFLANQPPVQAMCEAAPGIVNLLDRMGVMFNRTPEGLLDFRRFGGTKHHRTAFAGATTGQQIIYALDEQVRRLEVAGKVQKFEHWEFVRAVIDDKGVCQGMVAQNLHSLELKVFPADQLIICTGGIGKIFGKSTNSTICTGAAQGILFKQGAVYANGEFIQVHPTAIPGEDKLRLMSESARGEGGRVWVPKDGKPWYFLEEWYPAYGNLVPRDIATRAIFKVCQELKLGIDGKMMVYLDLSHIEAKKLDLKLGGIIEIYEKFVGDDPRKVPMRIFPGMHYTMGGLWIDFEHQTNIPGIMAAGECEYQYHGANRLGANSLLACIFGGTVAGPKAIQNVQAKSKLAAEQSSTLFEQALKQESEFDKSLMDQSGDENVVQVYEDLGTLMTENVTVIRQNAALTQTLADLKVINQRAHQVRLTKRDAWCNQEFMELKQLINTIPLAEAITKGALARDESRGAHYKPAFPDRLDKEWLKTTKASYQKGEIQLNYEAVDTHLIKPRLRKYDTEKTK
jgi:succinate dehydrogenase / fumarate reductase, flavoprotein subunit